MKSGIITWVQHSNMPILSVDAQPNGFRFVTGGSDHKVCIWNLLPAISLKYENPQSRQEVLTKHANDSALIGGLEIIEEEKKHEDEASGSRSGIDEDHRMIAQQLGKHESGEDHDMMSRSRSEGLGDLDDDEEEDKSESTLVRECEVALTVEDEEGFEGEIRLMAGLFESDKKRYQKLLAVRDNHTSPVNCVRWNPLGTLFISCSDDGSIILWEYVGEMNMQASGFQKSMYNVGTTQDNGRMGFGGAGNAAFEENKAGQQQQEDNNIYEEWRNKRTWKRHEGGVSDCAWSPDSIHFASCGTDSRVIIWSINEASPIKVIEAKANGITFDPFGRFMATQSSEDKSLTIWRIQQDFKIVTQECSHTSYYKQSMGMSLFRRLSWSADGQFISTTAGRVAGMHTAPLIERSTWKLAATLAGHAKSITSSRINSRLFRDPSNEDSQTGLSCYSVVAIASIDSTISVWKPGMEKPLTVVMDIFRMGASDLSWGFNGNVLLASSHDGKVFMIHYQSGKLGSPLTELEKQLIIEKKYGASILNEYKTHTKLNKSALIQSSVSTNAQTSQQQNKLVNGVKKIMPAMTMAYQSESQKIDPHQNPFHNQMLKDDSAMSFNGRLNNGCVGTGMQKIIQPSSSIGEVIRQIPSQVLTPPPTAPQVPPKPSTIDASSITKSIQLAPSLLQVVVPDSIQTQPLLSLVDGAASDFKQQQQQSMADQSNQEEQKRPISVGEDLENSGKKTKKQAKKRREADGAQVPMGLSAAISQPNVGQPGANGMGSNQQALSVSQSQLQGTKTNISQSTLQVMQREQYLSLERILSDGAQNQQLQVTVISLEDYQALTSVQGKEEMQLVLSARDIFSEEIRIMITNIDSGSQNEFTRRKCAEIRMYSGSENFEVERSLMDGEFIVMSSMCGAFYILYTSSGKLSIFNSRTTRPIRQGMLIDGVCFIDSNEENMTFAVLNLKGILSLYTVKIATEFASSFQQSLEACTLNYQCSLVDILKQRNSQSSLFSANGDSLDSAPKVSVKSMKLLPDTSVLVFLSDNTVFEYDPRMRLWRQTLLKESQISQSLQLSSASQLKFSSEHQPSTIPLLKNLSSVIAQLEQQTLACQPSISHEDLGGPQRSNLIDHQARLPELLDSLALYERLQMKTEFLYTLRMVTLCILQIGDMQRMREMMLEYKFVVSWEEEQMMSKGIGNVVTKDSAMANVALLMNAGAEDTDQEMLPEGEVKKGGRSMIERPNTLICGGLEKSQVFQEAVLPVLKTVSLSLGCDVKDYISRLLSIMFAPIHSQQQPQQQQQHQMPFETNPVNHMNDSQQLYGNHDLQSQAYFHQQQQHGFHGEFGYIPQVQQVVPQNPPVMQLPSIQNVLSAARIHNVVLNNNPFQ